MPTYRSFHNADPPALARLWRSRFGQPGFDVSVTTGILEQFVFSRLYFDPAGLILAWEGDRLVGAIHAGFGADDSGTDVSRDLGVISHVMLDCRGPEGRTVAAELINRAEAYLEANGAKVFYGGQVRPINPFYLGLYGGSELPGILETDTDSLQAFRETGYEEIDRTIAYRFELSRFRPTMDRRHVMVRRKMMVTETLDPPTANWWEACTLGNFDLIRFDVRTRAGEPVGHALFRGMDLGGTKATFSSAGLIELEVETDQRRQGVATYLLTEAFHILARQGVRRLGLRTMFHNAVARAFYARLGLEPADRGIVLRKK